MNKALHIILTKALIVYISAFVFSVHANELEIKKSEWREQYEKLNELDNKESLSLSELQLKNGLLNVEYNARNVFFKALALNYLDGNNISEELNSLPRSDKDKKILKHFSAVLLSETIIRLKKSKISEIKSFMKKYDEAYGANSIPLFKLSGAQINRESPTEEKGGFHRGNTSIFMDITRTSSEEWTFIFMHELFHSLDQELSQAVNTFSDETLFKSVFNMSKKYSNLVELNQNEMSLLDQWVMAGLNRGLLAEYRAWNFGFSVYEKGIKEGLWRKIPFVEQILSFKDKNEPMPTFIYRYLNERSTITDGGVLDSPIVAEKIKMIRNQRP